MPRTAGFKIIVLALAALSGALAPASAHAAPLVGISVTPGSISPVIAPGDNTTESVTVKNASASIITVDGRAAAAPDAPAISVTPAEFTLKPGESIAVTITISVSADASAGQRQDHVGFQVRPSGNGKISVTGQVEVTLNENIQKPVDQVQWQAPRFLDAGQHADFSVSARNAGSFVAPLICTVTIDGLLGGSMQITKQSQPVAVGQSASIMAPLDDLPFIGLKRVTVSVGNGVGAPVVMKSWLIVLPWKLGFGFLALGAAAFTGAWISRLR